MVVLHGLGKTAEVSSSLVTEVQHSLKPSSGDCANGLAQLLSARTEAKVAEQVAAPAETRTPNLHRATSLTRECGWKGSDRA